LADSEFYTTLIFVYTHSIPQLITFLELPVTNNFLFKKAKKFSAM